MSEQRIQTVKVVWKSDDAKQKVVEFTRSVKGTDKAVDELNKSMGENATVTAKTTLSKKELTAQARKEFTASTRLINKYNKLTDSLKHQTKMYGMTDDAAEIYTAQMKLGANATQEQKDEVERLIKTMQKQRSTNMQTQSSMRGLRGQAQNLGWQMQDVAVQMQAGTDALVVFSQQGSQIASGFGPAGAIVGALIAVGGALAGVAMKALTGKKSLEELAEAQKVLNSVFEDGETATDNLTEAYVKLFNKNKALAILTAQQAINAARDTRKASKEKLEEELKDNFKRISLVKLTGKETAVEAATAIEFNKRKIKEQKEYAKTLGITLEQYQDINKSVEDGLFGEASEKMAKVAVSSKGVTRAFTDISFAAVKSKQELSDSIAQIESLRKITTGEFQPKTKDETTDSMVDEIRKREERINRELKRLANERAKKLKKSAAERKKFAENFHKEEEKRRNDEIKALQKEAKRREKVLRDAEKDVSKGRTSDPVLEEMNEHNRILKTLYAERDALGLSSYEQRQRINSLIEQETDRHSQALIDAQVIQMNTNVMQLSAMANMMTATVDMISDGGEKIKAQTAEMNAFQKGMFLSTQALNAAMAVIQGMSIGMNLAANASLTDFTGLSSAAMMTLGTSLGAAQAGAIMGTTFAGMFDTGGVIPNGQAGVVAERYDELVGGTMVYNNSGSGLNVTGSKDTAAMMTGGGVNVTVVNNATGTVRADVQQMDENNVKILIAEHFSKNIDSSVSGVLGKKGSKTDKAMRQNFKTSRKF